LICFERTGLSRIKVHMTSICLNRFCRALVLLVALLEFSVSARAESLSAIFTNIAPATHSAIPRRASIIFIECDGLGYGDLSCYGQTKFQTPNLDKLATEGIRFTNYYADNSASSPAHAALLLGKDSAHLKQRADADVPLAADEVTVAQILRNSGYRTGLIGEWNLGDENSSGAPWKKGFDEFGGYFDPNDAENFYADYVWRFTPRSSYDKTSGKWIDWSPAQGQSIGGKEMIYVNTQGKNQYIPDLLTKAAMNFVKSNQPDPFNHYRPFFLLLNYKIPGGKIEVPTDAPFSDESWPQPEKNKAALISRIDGYIGELQEQLQKIGMTNNVAIFFSGTVPPKKTAEIDPEFFHDNISTNDLRVPMIAHWPGKIPAGQVSDFKWSPRDFLPTAAQIAFANSPTNVDGVSILPILQR
jgi:arylsulfatase A-like enzyme